MSNTRGRTLLIVVILLSAVLLAARQRALPRPGGAGADRQRAAEPSRACCSRLIHAVGQAVAQRPQFVWFFTGAPLLVGVDPRPARRPPARRRDPAGGQLAARADGDPTADGALRLLGPAAAGGPPDRLPRGGHRSRTTTPRSAPPCAPSTPAAARRCTSACASSASIGEDDGAAVEVPSGFDAAAVRLTGNVHGAPPFRGVLQHGGWRAAHVTLPKSGRRRRRRSSRPAEVEIALRRIAHSRRAPRGADGSASSMPLR